MQVTHWQRLTGKSNHSWKRLDKPNICIVNIPTSRDFVTSKRFYNCEIVLSLWYNNKFKVRYYIFRMIIWQYVWDNYWCIPKIFTHKHLEKLSVMYCGYDWTGTRSNYVLFIHITISTLYWHIAQPQIVAKLGTFDTT